MPNLLKLVVSIGFCEGIGLLGGFFTTPSIPNWYALLNKPAFNPPNWIFGPVWTVLYLLMGIAFYLIWQSKSDKNKDQGIKLFFVQLGLNFLWSLVFFGGHSLLGGLLVIIPLWYFIYLTIKNFLKVKKLAAYLLIPYQAWVSFAAILNFSLWFLNRI